ncbi:hypothetical protein DLREEDagrD3_28340 [Denitratisoma sp. agr-D3]
MSAWLDRAALLCLAAMAILPFQHPHHFNPIPSFLAEWWAALLGLAACALAFLRPAAWTAFPLPRILLLPLGLVLALLLQFAQGCFVFVQQGLIAAAVLLWAALMACLGRDLARRRGLDWLADSLAAAFLIGALLEVLVMVLQLAGWSPAGLVFPRQGAPYGNLAQQNHLNDYLWLGVASALYRHSRHRLPLTALLPVLTLLLLASALSTSRSILLYAIALGGLAWLATRRSAPALADTGDPCFRLWRLARWLLPAALASLVLSQALLPLLPAADLGSGTLQRFYAEANSGGVRLKLWRSAAATLGEAPWLGQGLGSLPSLYFRQAAAWPAGEAAPVAEHTHNLPLQWAVEFGLPLALAMTALLLWWLKDFLARSFTPARWWLLAMLAVMGIHSLLEYPLWYTFFLGPWALLLGAGDEGRRVLANGRRGLVGFALILLLAGAILGILRRDYLDMERLLNWGALGQGTQDMPTSVSRLLTLQEQSLLAPQATVTIALMLAPSRDHLEDRRALCRNALAFAPLEALVFKCLELDALAGDPALKANLAQARAAFPEAAKTRVATWRAQLAQRPELAALLASTNAP